MILVEGTLWPLVVVGALPDSGDTDDAVMTVDEGRLWSMNDLRVAIVSPAPEACGMAAQDEVFGWLMRHRGRLRRCASRVAWVFEDEAMRRSAERWLHLTGDRLFRGEVTTFRTVRAAVSWLAVDDVPMHRAHRSTAHA